MPTYQYRCTECGNELEAVQRFTDPSLTDCPSCEGQLRKVFNAVGVVFKGSGFYRTDSRADAKKSDAKGSDAGSTSGDKSSGEKGTGEKGSTEKKSSDSSSTEKTASKQPVGAGSSSGPSGGSHSGKGSSTAA